jgi:hypothetical protein
MSAALAVQGAINAALRASVSLDTPVVDRVYDRVPPNAALPYVHLREFQEVDDSTDCTDGWEVNVDLDVWSSAVGKPEASRIAMAIRDALHLQELELAEPYALVEIRHRDTVIGDGGDGLLSRARLSFKALVERV